MNAIVTRKTGQTYEVDDFQHNFESVEIAVKQILSVRIGDFIFIRLTTKCWYLSVEMWIFGSREDEKSWSMVMW